ncbi:uncharacterized protein LOC113867975 [Abrus precatorius]|uniref:Uncharacterized protein LOC113867975 n=1 Tax=Abrus precatorius TaxID=3816 RepID=A0A8B8LSF0_ABRPR|nr:uncharacterized protein LOC113867975 [Abrus precatorius]
MASSKQQDKIEELEAQLNEAEDVITDLRAELKHVRLELDKTRNSKVHPLNGQTVKHVASFQESAKPETSGLSSNKELECMESFDVKNKLLAVNVLDDKCCNSKDQTEQLGISNLEDYYGHDSDFTSIIMRTKEAELCRNGFTQRIRALEGNLLDEKLLKQDVHNQHSGKTLGLIAKDSDGQVAKFSALTEKTEIKKCVKRHKIPKQKVFSHYRSFFHSCKMHVKENCKSNKGACSLLPSIKPSAISKWKRRNRRQRHLGMKSSVLRSCKLSFILTGVTESVQAVIKFELVEKAIEKDNELLNLESAVQNLTGSGSNMKVEVIDVPSTNTDLEDIKAFEENDGSPGQVGDSRILKYTFQRKRKKESLGNTDQNIDSEKSTAKRRVEEKQNGASVPRNLA